MAYQTGSGVAISGDTAYVAGTRTAGDWARNTNIPINQTDHLPRYKTLEQALALRPEVRHIVGHSMGGSVALAYGAAHPQYRTTTYGAPVVSITPGERYRDTLDPVSMFDRGAIDLGVMVPHSAGRAPRARR